MRPARSLLFVPGNREDMLRKAAATSADALLPDLEDSVPVHEKQNARQIVGRFIAEEGAKPWFVRVNSVRSGLAASDLEAIVPAKPAGIFLPKVESTDEVRQADSWLARVESEAGLEHGSVEIVVMIESALAVNRSYDLATASPRVASLSFASAQNGDLQTDLGCDWSVEGTEMLYARSKVLLDARAAGIEFPLDGVYADLQDASGLIADSTLSRRLGYVGRSVIHPKQVAPVNEVYSPRAEEVDYYRRLIEAFAKAEEDGRAAVNFEGKMIDYAMVERARRVIRLAELTAELGAR